MPKQTSRSWIGLLRAFGVRGREDLAFPLDLGVKAIIDADRYDPNPHFLVGWSLGAQLAQRGTMELTATSTPLFIHQLTYQDTASTGFIFLRRGLPTVSPGPGITFNPRIPESSDGTPAQFGTVAYTDPAATSSDGMIVDNPYTLGPFVLAPGMQMRIVHAATNQATRGFMVIEQMGFE